MSAVVHCSLMSGSALTYRRYLVPSTLKYLRYIVNVPEVPKLGWCRDFPAGANRRAAGGSPAGDPRHGVGDARRDAGGRALAQRAEPPGRPGQAERAALLRVARGGAAGTARQF